MFRKCLRVFLKALASTYMLWFNWRTCWKMYIARNLHSLILNYIVEFVSFIDGASAASLTFMHDFSMQTAYVVWCQIRNTSTFSAGLVSWLFVQQAFLVFLILRYDDSTFHESPTGVQSPACREYRLQFLNVNRLFQVEYLFFFHIAVKFSNEWMSESSM